MAKPSLTKCCQLGVFLCLFPIVLVLWIGSSLRRLRRGKRPFTCLVQWSIGDDVTDADRGNLVQKRPSGTAFSSAFFRYHAYLEGLIDDYLIGNMLPLSARIVCRLCLCLSQLGFPELVDRSTCGYYAYSVCATRYFDEAMVRFADFDFIVNLGAGLDTRLFRLTSPKQQAFEVDIAPTQEMKKYLVNRTFSVAHRARAPIFVAVDFGKDNIIDKLVEAGFVRNRKTLFIMECVSFYLTKEAIRDTLQSLSQASGPGSVLAFDYMEDTWSDHRRRLRAKEVFGATSSDRCERAGEPFRFGLDKDETPQQVFSPFGYEVIEHLKPADYAERYLTGTGHRASEKCHLCLLEVVHPESALHMRRRAANTRIHSAFYSSSSSGGAFLGNQVA